MAKLVSASFAGTEKFSFFVGTACQAYSGSLAFSKNSIVGTRTVSPFHQKRKVLEKYSQGILDARVDFWSISVNNPVLPLLRRQSG